jgi:ADP-ribosylglycohydrolase
MENIMRLPNDYLERVYAGVLGKIIGVYLGRPVEGWPYEKIMAELGEINYYVHKKRGFPMIAPDDDISGTFTFLRAFPDYGNNPDLSPAQIGQTWLNYLIENRTILWWGGLGNSTEHTAYIRLKNGISAPLSGSIEKNGKVVAEQIGSQIFIDGWAMVFPGDPERAVDFSRRAGSVSHDGEAIYGAQVIASMEAQAFVESDVDKLIDTAITFIPKDSVIYRMISEVRAWHAKYPDWHTTREKIAANYGYDKYGGNCHMVPNHALIHLGLLYGRDDFQKALMITNTSGWDTDCNSGNLGCLMGILLGLKGIDCGPDWRGPVADRLYLPSADGGRCITDAVSETYQIVNIGRSLANQEPLAPKNNARFHFELPGSMQGFQAKQNIENKATLLLENVAGHSLSGSRSLALRYQGVGPAQPVCAATPTFIPPDAMHMPGYGMASSPTLYPGQIVSLQIEADGKNPAPVSCRLFLSVYTAEDTLAMVYGPEESLRPGQASGLNWRIPDQGGQPIAEIGLELQPASQENGVVYLDSLTWEGTPELVFKRPAGGGSMWRQAWVNGMDHLEARYPEFFRPVQDSGRGLVITGCREWGDYRVSADVTPHMAEAAGIAARVQGMRRYYALLLCRDDRIRLVKSLDGERLLAETEFSWKFGETHQLSLQVQGNRIQAFIGERILFDVEDAIDPLVSGGIALVCEEGRTGTWQVKVDPIA